MSDTSLVVYCKISREDFNSLTIKDEDTLYAVNDNGDFSMANLNDSAELYLGNKKLFPTIVGTTGQSTTSVMHQKATTDAIAGLQNEIENIDLSKYLPLTGGTLTGRLTTKGLVVNGGDVKLANFTNAKIHGHINSQALGNYSTALGYNSRTQVPTGDTTFPYGYITSVSPLSFTIVDDTLYGVSLAKNDSTTYTYNGVDYTVTNPNSSYAASVFLVQDTDNTLLKGTSYPNNVCIIAKSSVTVGIGRILAVKNIVDDVYEIIVNQQNSTLQSYTSALKLYMFKKSSSSNYSGASSVASGNYSVASGNYSVASGYSSVASGYSSVASGYSSVASGSYSVASGYSSVASGYSSVASGVSSVASGYYSVASGVSSVASGDSSVASGVSSVASGYSSVASGVSSVARGSYSVASGVSSVASGDSSVASGRNAKATHQDSVVLATGGISGRNQQCVVGAFNKQDSSAYFVVGNGSSDTARSNAMTVGTNGTTNIAGNLLPMVTNSKSLGSAFNKWANVYATTFNGNATSADKVNNALTIKSGSTETYDGSAAKTIDITKLDDIGTLSDLQTSDKTSLVNAINEVNTKANQGGSGIINDSTISPFAGYLPSGSTVIDSSSASTNGEVLYDLNNNRFIWKDLSGTFVQFYANWETSYLYNTTSDASASAKSNKLFSYNDAHYMVINGMLQDISNIESTLKAYTDDAATTVQNYATSQANNALTLAKNYSDNNLNDANTYTDTQFDERIQLVSTLPSNPVANVLYLIPDE